MPPKKGKGKKKGGKGKGDKKAPAPPAEAKEPPLNELSKQFYLIQIKASAVIRIPWIMSRVYAPTARDHWTL